jgi:hypothetical protein
MAEQLFTGPGQPTVTMAPVNAKMFEAVGYTMTSRKLFIRFRDASMICFEGVPGFRYQGLLASPRPDAYFKSYIKDLYLSKVVPPPSE